MRGNLNSMTGEGTNKRRDGRTDWKRKLHLNSPPPHGRDSNTLRATENFNMTYFIEAYDAVVSAIIGLHDGLSSVRHQAIIWTNAGLLSNETLGTNFSGILIEIQTFSLKRNAFENIVWKMSAISSQPQCVKTSGRDLNIWQRTG